MAKARTQALAEAKQQYLRRKKQLQAEMQEALEQEYSTDLQHMHGVDFNSLKDDVMGKAYDILQGDRKQTSSGADKERAELQVRIVGDLTQLQSDLDGVLKELSFLRAQERDSFKPKSRVPEPKARDTIFGKNRARSEGIRADSSRHHETQHKNKNNNNNNKGGLLTGKQMATYMRNGMSPRRSLSPPPTTTTTTNNNGDRARARSADRVCAAGSRRAAAILLKGGGSGGGAGQQRLAQAAQTQVKLNKQKGLPDKNVKPTLQQQLEVRIRQVSMVVVFPLFSGVFRFILIAVDKCNEV